MEIRTKLTLLFTSIVATMLFIFSFAIFYFYSLNREVDFYERLKDKAQKTAELLLEVEEIDKEILQIVDKHDITTLFSEEIMMYDTTFTLFYKSGEEYIHLSNSTLDDIFRKGEIRLRTGERETVGILTNIKNKPLLVVASAIDRHGYDKLEYLILILSLGWGISIIITFFVGRYFASNALIPITEVITQVESITASNLNTRVQAGSGQDEIANLAATFNQMLERIEDAFSMQKNFVANASHELRTPLTSVTGQIEVTLMQERSISEYQQALKSVLEDVKNLTKVSNGLLELAKVSADKNTFRPIPYRIDELIWQTRSELLKKHPNYKINVEFENFPEEENELILLGSPNLLKTAFINLMENACKFSPNKTVDVLLIFVPKQVKILFMDTGIGIPKEDLPNIFQPFYRSQKNKVITGFGIGLSLVNKIALLHKGNIEIDSTENKGSIFTFTLQKTA
jgi:signal transduction histidine kinase